jgi:uncharacterized pyridoxamine 5'-phosphate oxidase family protein
MQEILRFFKENPVQYLATSGLDGKPKVRPFQFMFEQEGKLWFCTNSEKEVFKELSADSHLEICISAPDYSWLRIAAKAVFADDSQVKERMLVHSPLVKNLYKTADNPLLKAFYLEEVEALVSNLPKKPY